jgi:hypothetical protein
VFGSFESFVAHDLEKRSLLIQMPILTKLQIPFAIGFLCLANWVTRYRHAPCGQYIHATAYVVQ